MVSQKLEKTKEKLLTRPPVVTVLGHIDHGKSTLLDFIRKSNITGKEYGGITQHIGAYQVKIKTKEGPKKITFIDTPGHEAFAKMRSRGGKIADVALLVIAANDGVMPQTKESIKHIKAAKIPVVVAINKIDLFSKKSDRQVAIEKIKKSLAKEKIEVEDFGGEVVVVPISAKKGEGVDNLLEMLLLVAEMKGIKSDPTAAFSGVIIESKLDSKRGVVATILVKDGSLKIGDMIIAENIPAKVRALFDEHGKKINQADPGKPVEVLGFSQVPKIGSKVIETKDQKPKTEEKPQSVVPFRPPALFEKRLKIILKTDVLGSQEAIIEALKDMVEVIAKGVGEITESDVFLAKTAGAVIVGFNVKLASTVARLAEEEKVKVKTYKIIYKLLEEIKEVVKLFKEKPKEKILGKGEIIAEFPFKKLRIAGVKVFEGRLARGDKIKVVRDRQEIGQSKIKNLRYGKEDIDKSEQGKDCGVLLEPQLDFKIGDVIKSIG